MTCLCWKGEEEGNVGRKRNQTSVGIMIVSDKLVDGELGDWVIG
jgi:hypothetical protein